MDEVIEQFYRDQNSLDYLSIRGFKSIRELNEFPLRKLNLFVGANGSGKSNLISFFRMLNALVEGRLSEYVRREGGIGDLLFNGRKITKVMEFEARFGVRGYRFSIEPDAGEGFAITKEARYYAHSASKWWSLGSSGNDQSLLAREAAGNVADSHYSRPVCAAIRSWRIYHFHDTSSTAPMRHAEIVQDHAELRSDAANLAPFLLWLREAQKDSYREILNACRLVIPYLDDFLLIPQDYGQKSKVALSWKTKGSDYPMQPYQLSDGSIRFICLATALLQPNPPATLIIDEPELGLHPEAIRALAEIVQNASKRNQIIIATQSPLFLDQFSIEDVVVVNRKDGQSTFERLKSTDYDVWLQDYSVGQLWTKNVIQGGTSHE